MKKEQIIEKIKALMEKTIENGCSEAEALAASEKVADLLVKYEIQMSEIEYRETGFGYRLVDTGKKKP